MGKTPRKQQFLPQSKSFKPNYRWNDKLFRWKFEKCFWEHENWLNIPSVKIFVNNIISKLQDFETMTWQEILNAAGGKPKGKGNNNHFVDVNKLPVKEKKLLDDCGYAELYKEIFSLRLSGKERLFGVVDSSIFYVLLYDPNHEFRQCQEFCVSRIVDLTLFFQRKIFRVT